MNEPLFASTSASQTPNPAFGTLHPMQKNFATGGGGGVGWCVGGYTYGHRLYWLYWRLSLGRGVYSVFHVWGRLYFGVLACAHFSWPHALCSEVTRGMEGSRCERLISVNRFGCCHQPGQGIRSLGLKTASGYKRFGVNKDMQHATTGRGRGVGGSSPIREWGLLSMSPRCCMTGCRHHHLMPLPLLVLHTWSSQYCIEKSTPYPSTPGCLASLCVNMGGRLHGHHVQGSQQVPRLIGRHRGGGPEGAACRSKPLWCTLILGSYRGGRPGGERVGMQRGWACMGGGGLGTRFCGA